MGQGHRKPGSGLLLVALAAFFWGLSGGVAGLLVGAAWDPTVVAFYRGAVGLLCVLAWLALSPRRSGLGDRRLWFLAAIAGLGVAGNFTFYFISIANGSVGVAVTLMYCAPVWVFLVSFALRLETPSIAKWLGIALVMAGVVLLTGLYDLDAVSVTPLGIVAGLLSGVSYAVFIFGFKYAAGRGSPQAILAIAFTVLVAVLAWVTDPAQVAAVPRSAQWPLFLLLGVLGAGLSFFLYVAGMRLARPTNAAVVAMVEPVTAALFGVAILGEALAAPQLLGMALILATVTALGARSRVRNPAGSGPPPRT